MSAVSSSHFHLSKSLEFIYIHRISSYALLKWLFLCFNDLGPRFFREIFWTCILYFSLIFISLDLCFLLLFLSLEGDLGSHISLSYLLVLDVNLSPWVCVLQVIWPPA